MSGEPPNGRGYKHADITAAENLIAGFDRPARTGAHAPEQRDFIEYYTRKKADQTPAPKQDQTPQPSLPTSDPRPAILRSAIPTVVIPRGRARSKGIVFWGVVAFAMAGLVGLIAAIAMRGTP